MNPTHYKEPLGLDQKPIKSKDIITATLNKKTVQVEILEQLTLAPWLFRVLIDKTIPAILDEPMGTIHAESFNFTL